MSVPPIPEFQRAIVEDATGKPVLVHDAPVPRLGPRTLLVKTTAVAINPSDYKIGANRPARGAIVGLDFAGIILRMDAEAAALRPDLSLGDRVCGFVHGSNPLAPDNGSFAEYLRAHAQLVYRVPEGTGDEEAAAMGVATATAAMALWHSLRLPASPEAPLMAPAPDDGGDDDNHHAPAAAGVAAAAPTFVLVYGASTASGTMALQLLNLSGFMTVATCSPRNFALVKSYGAHHVFDYADVDKTTEAIRQLTSGQLEHAMDCITDKFSVACCHAAMARTGGRCVTLEMVPNEDDTTKLQNPLLRRRRAVKEEFIIALGIFGEAVRMGPGYERDADPALHRFAVHWYGVMQRLIDGGKLRAHPVEVVGSGFESVLRGIRQLKSGSVSGKKLVCLLE